MSKLTNLWHIEDKVELGAALVLFISPWVLQFTDIPGAALNAWLCGAAVSRKLPLHNLRSVRSVSEAGDCVCVVSAASPGTQPTAIVRMSTLSASSSASSHVSNVAQTAR